MLNPYPEPQFKRYIPSYNSRNISKTTFEISPKPCRPCISKASKTQFWPLLYRLALPKGSARRNLLLDHLAEDTCCQASSASEPTYLQTSPSGITFTVRRHALLESTVIVVIAWRFQHYARRHTSTRILLIFRHTGQIAHFKLGIKTRNELH